MIRMSRKLVGSMLAAGLLVSVALFGILHQLESERIKARFHNDIQQRITRTEGIISQQFELLLGLANAVALIEAPRPDRFSTLSANLLARHPLINSLSWYWYTDQSSADDLRQALANYYGEFEFLGFSDQSVQSISAQKPLTPAPAQANHLILIAIAPANQFDYLLGFDLATRAAMLKSLLETLDSSDVYVSGTYRRSGDGGDQLDFSIFSAVKNDQGQFLGLVSAAYAVAPLIHETFSLDSRMMALTIKASYNRQLVPVIFRPDNKTALASEYYDYQGQVRISGNRYWDIRVQASADYIRSQRGITPYIALASGVIISLLLAYILANKQRQSTQLETLVAERTEELSAANQRLKALSQTDALTGVANRRLFEERLHHEWLRLRRARKYCALMMIDVDFFKRYNDYYGHQQGDICLTSIAHAIDETVQRPADLVARYGGEEFVILLPDTDNKALELAREILGAVQALKIPHARSTVSDWVSISIGFGFARTDKLQSPQQLIIAADQALYAAKAAGRNQIAFASALNPDDVQAYGNA